MVNGIFLGGQKRRRQSKGGMQVNPEIFDAVDGIEMFFPLGEGYGLSVFIEDEAAQEMINIIQNKLNARL